MRWFLIVLVLSVVAAPVLWVAPRIWRRIRPDPTSPLPPSPVFSGVEFSMKLHKRLAPGSDNWNATWAADGHLYSAFGDGGGFGGTGKDGRVSLGIARIEGTGGSYRGYNVWGGKDAESPAAFDGKSYGIIALGDELWMWSGPGSDTTSYTETRLSRSRDHGRTWERLDWAYTKADRLVMPTICQFGRGYEGARDEFIYTYWNRLVGDPSKLGVHAPGQTDLSRAPRDRFGERAAHEFFAGLDADGRPTWTTDLKARKPVLENPHGVGWCASAVYHPTYRRYLYATEHSRTFRGDFALYDAPEPWGPWTTVGYWTNWEGTGSTFLWSFPSKWLEPDGSFTMVFTGVGHNDAWNTVQGRFLLRDAPTE